jgi:hypothetical protein
MLIFYTCTAIFLMHLLFYFVVVKMILFILSILSYDEPVIS